VMGAKGPMDGVVGALGRGDGLAVGSRARGWAGQCGRPGGMALGLLAGLGPNGLGNR